MAVYETYDLGAAERRGVCFSRVVAHQIVAAIGNRSGHAAAVYTVEHCTSPVADFPTSNAPTLRVITDVDGVSLSFDADEIVVFPSWDGAEAAARAAREAMAELAACLANPSLKRSA